MAKKTIIHFSALGLLLLVPSIAVMCKSSSPDDQYKAQIDKAKSLRASGSSDEARKIYESVLPPLRAQAPSQELIDTLNNLSDIATMSGEYPRAVALSRESAAACQKMQDKNCEAQAHDDAGLALSNSGNYTEAAAELDLGLKLTAETGNAQTAVLILNNLGSVYFYQAKYSEALRTYESALRYLEKAGAEPWTAIWRQLTQLNLATLYQRLGNDQRAIKIYDDVLSHPDKDLTPRDIAHMDANMGAIYRRLGDPKQALLFYGYADEYYAKEKDIDGELGVLKNSGIVLALELRRYQDALKKFDRVRALAQQTKSQREAMQAVLYRGETLYLMGKLEDAQSEFATALAAAEQLGTVEEQWKAIDKMGEIALSKGQREIAEAKFRDAIQRIESLRSQLQLSRLKSDFLADKRDVYDALIKLLLERNDAAGAFEFMERSRARIFQDRFFGGQLSPGTLSLHSIQARLDPQSALIEFWAGSDGVAAVWVTRDSAGISQSHFSSAEMEAFAQVVSKLPDILGDDWQKNFHKIGNMVAKEIVPLTQDRFSHVLIVPDGFLSLIPFELLPTASGQPLLETRDVTYMPSAVLLLRGAMQNASATRLPWQQQLVGFGDPSVIGGGESSLTSAPRGEITGSLPASGDEIRGIARMSAGRTKLFLGPDDRKRDFFTSAHSGAALLHVSTHAVADMDDPERSRLLFSPDEPGQPNNYLFLKELYDLDLRGMSLATLSACDTERGRLVPGEGIQAFSRALLAAGSRSALTTLWRVPDEPTAQFMQHFYFYLLKKRKSKAEALRLTKLDFLHSGTALSHPRYWAAFVLNGDGAEPVPRFIPWQALAIPVPLVALAAFIFFRVRRKRKRAAASV
ncbi:MAG TPA: CHAT domain-containing tetratricopeptide repeat protein [Candidatus Angelobacter sp.]